MKKLGKLTLKELEKESFVIDFDELRSLIGGSVSWETWSSWSDQHRAQHVVNAYMYGEVLGIEQFNGWSTGATGEQVSVNGKSFQLIVAVSSAVNDDDLNQYGYYLDDTYENPGGTWVKGYVGSVGATDKMMMNPAESQADDFYDEMSQYR